MRSAVSFLACALAAAAACGGQTGEGDYGGNACVDREDRSLGDTEEAPLGYSPADVLEFASPQTFRMELASSSAAPLMATLTLRPHAGTARFIRTEPQWSTPFPDPCRGRIEQAVDIELDVEQPSGTVQLRAAGTLGSDSRYRARLGATFSAADVDRIHPIELGPGEELRKLELRATLTPAGSVGSLEAHIAYWVRVGPQPEPRGDAPRARDYMTDRQAPVANWPAASSCAPMELPLPVDRSLFDVLPAEVLAAFAQPRALRWSDGASTQLTFDVRATGDACLADLYASWFEKFDYPPIAPEDPATFGLPIELTMATDDGRLHAQFSTMLQYQPDKDGGLASAWLIHYAKLAPGDDGGWSVDVDDIEVGRSTIVRILLQSDGTAATDRSMITLAGPPGSDPCGPTTVMCAGTPPLPATLLRGTLE